MSYDMSDTVALYRAVGNKELASIKENNAFLPGGNSLDGRQFAFTEAEVLAYAKTDPSKTEVVRVTVPRRIMDTLHDFSKDIDTTIFVNGVLTVQLHEQELFNKAIIDIEFIRKVGEL